MSTHTAEKWGEGFAFFRWQTMKYDHTPYHIAPGISCCLVAWRRSAR